MGVRPEQKCEKGPESIDLKVEVVGFANELDVARLQALDLSP